MKQTAYMLLLILLASSDFPLALTDHESAPKGTFTRENKLYIVADSKSVPREIASEVLPAVRPRWSPDGTKILYAKPGNTSDKATIVVLVVVDEKGTEIADIPVVTGTIDGVTVGGMRFVEQIGWLNETQVFAVGSANPSVDEMRIFNVAGGGEIQGYTGFSFAMCPENSRVAYFEPRFGRGAFKLSVGANESASFSPQGEDYSLRFLSWIRGCSELAVIESLATKSNLLILSNGHIESKVPLPVHPVLQLQLLPDALLVSGTSSKVLIDLKGLKVRTSDLADSSAYKEFEARSAIEKSLEAQSIDWYPTW